MAKEKIFPQIGSGHFAPCGWWTGKYANIGAQFRLGWSLPNNFGSYIIQPSCECQPPGGLDSAPSDTHPLFTIHVYTILDGQTVLRDIF